MSMEGKTNLFGIDFDRPVIMNGAGSAKTIEELEILVKSSVAIPMIGTITIPQREGNAGETFWADDWHSLNSVGLRNLGAPYYSQYLPEMVYIAHNAGKLLAVSVAGFSPKEYAILTKLVFEKKADLVELDLGCANIWENGEQEHIACFDPVLLKQILKIVEESVGTQVKVVAKLSPFSDPFLLKEIAKIISQFEMIKAVTTTNTFPNCLDFDEKGKPRTTPAGGLAAMGGGALRPIALGQVKQLRSFLPESIDLIGVGGISGRRDTGGKHIEDFEQAGAKAVQITTPLLIRPPGAWPQVFTDLVISYAELKE